MKSTIAVWILLLATALAGHGAPVLTLDPPGGAITGVAGATTGWGFRLAADPNEYVSVIGSLTLFETNPSLGIYLDFIGNQGGPVAGTLAPGAADWVQGFDANLVYGLASYTIDPLAQPGDSNSGTIRVLYETFSDNPNTCGGCLTGSGFIDAPFTVTVTTPEPGTMVMFAIAAGLLLIAVSRRYWNRPCPERPPAFRRE